VSFEPPSRPNEVQMFAGGEQSRWRLQLAAPHPWNRDPLQAPGWRHDAHFMTICWWPF